MTNVKKKLIFINIPMLQFVLIQYFTVSTCELFARVQPVME